MRKRRAEAAAAGLCKRCAARPTRPGLKTCEICGAAGNKAKRKSYARKKVREFLGIDDQKPDA